MSRLLAPVALVLMTGPALAQNIVFEVPRFNFPAPHPTVQTDTLSTQGQ